jgi:hypothetical protein
MKLKYETKDPHQGRHPKTWFVTGATKPDLKLKPVGWDEAKPNPS